MADRIIESFLQRQFEQGMQLAEQSDLLTCEPDLSRVVSCPIRVGSVTFHHGKTPHMTPPNQSDAWRRAVTTHMRVVGTLGEGDHYPWKIYVNQVTGERIKPPSR